jgi:hypothetical protein
MSPSPRKLPDDPNLSEEANRLVAEELEQATGEPIDRTRPAEHAPASEAAGRPVAPFFATLAQSRVPVVMGLAGAVVFGVIVSLATGSWWLLALAFAVFLLATLVVALVVVRTTGMVERPRPQTIAKLEDEGVPDPERLVNERLAELGAKPPEPSHEDTGGDGAASRGTRPAARRRE